MAGKIVVAGIWMPLDTYSLLIETLLSTLNRSWPLAEHRLARNSVSCREAYAASIYSKSDPNILDLGFKPGRSKWAGSPYQKRPGKKQSRQMCVVLVSYIYMDVSMFIPCHVMSPVPSFQHLWHVRWNQEVATSNKQELPISAYNTYTGCTHIYIHYTYVYTIYILYIYIYYIHSIYIYYMHIIYIHTIYILYIYYIISHILYYIYPAGYIYMLYHI